MGTVRAALLKVGQRVRRMSLIEALLTALLLSSLVNGSRASDIDSSLHQLEGAIVDVHNEVTTQSEAVQSDLDDIKSKLDEIQANQ